MSLANKYRSTTFDEMVGQKHIIPILKANVVKGVNINYLLYGPRGTGKTSSARLLAKGINCLNTKDGNPCNQCENCQSINNQQTIDIVEIDAASHTGVDNIREEIIDKEMYRPNLLKKKIYIIDEVHMLSKGAFNALLKIMEEPQEYMCFILATTEIHKVPDTIISRCQVFNFKRINEDLIIGHLAKISKKEKLTYSDAGLSLIAKVSDGCMRDAIKYLDQVSILENIDEENVSKFLGIAGDNIIKNFVELIKKNTKSDIFDFLDNLEKNGTDLSQFAKDILGYCNIHFSSDIKFFTEFSEKVKNVYLNIKLYPQAVLAYKVEFGK